MKIRSNKIFVERFGNAFRKPVTLPPALLSIVDSGFVLENGAWFVTALRGRGSNANQASFSTLTELECFFNHLHLDDFGGQNFLENALYCDAVLRQCLTGQLGGDVMRSIISLDKLCVFFAVANSRRGELECR